MKNYIHYILIFFVLYSCSDDLNFRQEDNPLFSNSRAISTSQENIFNLEDFGIYNPTKVILKDSIILVFDQLGKYKLSIYHKESGQLIGNYLPTGTGDEEGLYFLTMNLDEDNYLRGYDFGNDRMFELDINNFDPQTIKLNFINLPTDTKHLEVIKSGSLMISTGAFLEGRFCLIKNNHQNYFLDYPEIEGYDHVLYDSLKYILFSSNILKLKPDNTKFVCANKSSGILDLCSLTPNNTITRIKELNFYTPKATLARSRNIPVAYSADNLTGFLDVQVTDTYIYTLYSGRSFRDYKESSDFGERIIVFDWEGNHVKTYLLKTPLKSISYNKEENCIFGLATYPETVLIKHEL